MLDKVTIAVQINGKLRATFEAVKGLDKVAILNEAKKLKNVAEQVEGKTLLKEIVVPDKIVNFVIK
nr:hypothetical protein [Spiroplasma clarkii]